MTAAIEALSALKQPCSVLLTTDSKYLQDGITSGFQGGNKTVGKQKKKIVKNIDLWKQLDQLVTKHRVKWNWVKGNDGHRENEIVDELAQTAIQDFMVSLGVTVQPTLKF